MALSEEGREAQSRDNQMLVEREGKYELVDAYDVQIVTSLHQEAKGATDVGADTSGILQVQDNQLTEKNGQLTGKQEHQGMGRKEEASQISHRNLADQDKDEDYDDNCTSEVVDVSATQREASVAKKDSVLSAVSTYALNREKEVKNHISSGVRTKSAPGPRSRKDEGDEQKRRNEAAFSAWLTSKNEELAKRRQMERQECRMKEENLMHKQSLNEAAYKAWLERKASELQMKRKSASRPATSVAKVDEAAKQAAFEAWLESKRKEHRQKMETEREKRSQEEEKAKNSDPTLVEQAYKRLVYNLMLGMF